MRTLGAFIVLLVSGCTFGRNGLDAETSPPLAKPQKQVISEGELDGFRGRVVTVVGEATEAKLGAIVVHEHSAFFIDNLEAWPQRLKGNRVEVTGTLILRDLGPPPETGPDSRLSARAYGKGWLLKDASWREASKSQVQGVSASR